MSSLVRDDLTRAATFFTLAFGLTAVGGLAIGDLRLGVEYGLALGVAFAAFAYFFVVPTAEDADADGEDDADVDGEDDTDADVDGDGEEESVADADE